MLPHKLSVLSYFCIFEELLRRVRDANHDKRRPIEFAGSCRVSARDPFRCRNGGRGQRNFLCTPDWQFPLDTVKEQLNEFKQSSEMEILIGRNCLLILA